MAAQQVLILTKEKALGTQCEKVLHAQGCECTRMLVNEEFTSEMLLDKLVLEGQEVVLCEFRMSPYTALKLLRDLNGASLTSRVQVAALSFEDRHLDEFYRLGGAAHGLLQPGERELKEVIEETWRRIQDNRSHIGKNRSEVIAYLRSLKDERVFRQFAIDLFRHLEYQEVHEAHGALEVGKDIIFYEQNKMGEIEYVGVQAKIGDIHGTVSRSGNATALWLQTMEALNSEIFFGGASHYLDKYVILASGTISNPARTKIEEFLRNNKYNKRVYFWGQEKIADVKVQYAPTFIHFPI